MSVQTQIAIQLLLLALAGGASAYFRALSTASALLTEELAPERRGFRLALEPKWAFWTATAVYAFSVLIILGLLATQGFAIAGAALLVFAAAYVALRKFVVPAPSSDYWAQTFRRQLMKRIAPAMQEIAGRKPNDPIDAYTQPIDRVQIEIEALTKLMERGTAAEQAGR